jgi:4-hydroxy-2-oxoheptanedioate aldolase
MKTNAMKSKLLAGEAALGCSIMVPSPQMVEMVAHAGFDWVLIDLEHGTIGLETAELMIMAAEASGITPIARPRSNRPRDITSVMDRGAMGVQVPHVNNAEAARRAVAAVRFGPGDNRGVAGGTRPDAYGLGGAMDDFVERSNAQTLVCVQLEHAAALENVDEILAVDGVDVFFIGPSDLSQSMGYPGDPKAEPVAAAIGQTLASITAAGKIPGLPATAANIDTIIGAGARYIYTHLPKLVGAGAAGFLHKGRSGAPES